MAIRIKAVGNIKPTWNVKKPKCYFSINSIVVDFKCSELHIVSAVNLRIKRKRECGDNLCTNDQ